MDELIQITDKPIKKNWGELLSYIFLPLLFTLPVFLAFMALFLFGVVNLSWFGLLLITVLPVCFVFTFYFYGVKPRKISLSEIGFYPIRFKWWWILITIAIAVTALVVIYLVSTGSQKLFGKDIFEIGRSKSHEVLFNDLMKYFPAWIVILGIGIIGPLGEEIIFRGAIYTWFRRYYNVSFSVISSAIIFAILHLNLPQIIVGIIIGCTLALVFEKTKSIWACFALHAIYNTSVVLIVYFNIF